MYFFCVCFFLFYCSAHVRRTPLGTRARPAKIHTIRTQPPPVLFKPFHFFFQPCVPDRSRLLFRSLSLTLSRSRKISSSTVVHASYTHRACTRRSLVVIISVFRSSRANRPRPSTERISLQAHTHTQLHTHSHASFTHKHSLGANVQQYYYCAHAAIRLARVLGRRRRRRTKRRSSDYPPLLIRCYYYLLLFIIVNGRCRRFDYY